MAIGTSPETIFQKTKSCDKGHRNEHKDIHLGSMTQFKFN